TQAVVGKIHCLIIDIGFMVRLQMLGFIDQSIFMAASGLFTAYLIDDLALRDRGDPRRGIIRYAFLSPVDDGRGEGFLHRLLSQVKGTGETNQSCNDLAGLLPED